MVKCNYLPVILKVLEIQSLFDQNYWWNNRNRIILLIRIVSGYVYFFPVEYGVWTCFASFLSRYETKTKKRFVLDKNDESCIVDSRKCEFLQWHLLASIETVKFSLVFHKLLWVHTSLFLRDWRWHFVADFLGDLEFDITILRQECYIGECYLQIVTQKFMLLPLSSPICPVIESAKKFSASNLMSLNHAYSTINFQHIIDRFWQSQTCYDHFCIYSIYY